MRLMIPLRSIVVLGFLAISVTPFRAAAGGLEIFDQHALALRHVSLVTLVYDGESGFQNPFPALIERELGKAGYTVDADCSDEGLVIIPTSGRISSSGPASPMSAGIVTATASPLTASLTSGRHARGTGGGGPTRVGLLLTAYRASDWRVLEESGKIPRPVWRIYESQDCGSSGFPKACLDLVKKCVQDLKNSG